MVTARLPGGGIFSSGREATVREMLLRRQRHGLANRSSAEQSGRQSREENNDEENARARPETRRRQRLAPHLRRRPRGRGRGGRDEPVRDRAGAGRRSQGGRAAAAL